MLRVIYIVAGPCHKACSCARWLSMCFTTLLAVYAETVVHMAGTQLAASLGAVLPHWSNYVFSVSWLGRTLPCHRADMPGMT